MTAGSKPLDPRAHLYFPRPGATVLLQQAEVSLSDGVRVERTVRPVGRIGSPRAANAAVDHDVGNMDALRRKLARQALRQATQGELAHRERRRLRITLDAG